MTIVDDLRNNGCDGMSLIGGWTSRGRQVADGVLNAIGVMVHHTAGSNTLKMCINGRTGVPGPLCNFHIAKDGLISLVADGVANGSGKGSSVVLKEVSRDIAPSGDARSRSLPNDINSGNPHFWNIEVENLGNGSDPYPKAQIDSLVRLCAALCKLNGWTANRVIHHREWTNRKIDMSYKGDLRGAIAQAIGGQAPARPVAFDTLKQGDRGQKVAELQNILNFWGYNAGTADGIFGQRTTDALKRYQSVLKITPDGVWGPATATAHHNLMQYFSSLNK